jgi:hypothetical protein
MRAPIWLSVLLHGLRDFPMACLLTVAIVAVPWAINKVFCLIWGLP